MKELSLRPVKSSTIEGYSWDTEGTLTVKFKAGSVYSYKNVPYEVLTGLEDAESKGRYFAANIKEKYDTEKVQGAPKKPQDESVVSLDDFDHLSTADEQDLLNIINDGEMS